MWNPETLQQINRADDLKIAPHRSGKHTTGTPTWIWEVVVENCLFVRAYSGTRSRWYQAALAEQSGEIHAIGQVFAVRFTKVEDAALNDKIDEAYREKYASSSYMRDMISPRAREATVEVLAD